MVMWFGFGWESKAAVIVVMTFFPMLINTIAGLAASDHMQRDLMRSYGAGYWQTFCQLRLPAALPFIFNALKINSTLALIGAIVAELFGSPHRPAWASGSPPRSTSMNVDVGLGHHRRCRPGGVVVLWASGPSGTGPHLLAPVLSCKNAKPLKYQPMGDV